MSLRFLVWALLGQESLALLGFSSGCFLRGPTSSSPSLPKLTRSTTQFVASRTLLQLRRGGLDDSFLEGDGDDGIDDFEDGGKSERPLVRKKAGAGGSKKKQGGLGLNSWEILNRAVIAGVFVAGIGTGVTIDSAINTNPKDLASRDAIDKNAPNPKLCAAYGSSAMVLDERVFITFNPFNVFVTQADTKPGCVLRPSNVVAQLQKERKLISDADVEACKNGFNTWAFVGDIDDKPQLNCVFQSDDAQNEFLSNPKVGLGEDIYDTPSAANAIKPGPGGDAPKPKTVQQQVARLRPNPEKK